MLLFDFLQSSYYVEQKRQSGIFNTFFWFDLKSPDRDMSKMYFSGVISFTREEAFLVSAQKNGKSCLEF